MNNLLSLIRCPNCGKKLQKKKAVMCIGCHTSYAYRDGVLNLLSPEVFTDKHNEQQKEYYDREYVDDYANTDFEWRKRYIDRIVKNLPTSKSAVILDAACGQGYVTLALAERGYTIIANDIAVEGLRRAYRLAKDRHIEDRILFIASDLNKTSLQSSSLSAVILLHVLEHMKDDKNVTKNVTHMLRTGGIAIIGVPLAFRYVFPLFAPLYWYSDQRVGHFRHYALSDIQKRLGKKYKTVQVLYTGHVIKLIGAFLSVLRISFFDQWIENVDERFIHSKFWASNIMVVAKKQ